jgi:hypothetical protein
VLWLGVAGTVVTAAAARIWNILARAAQLRSSPHRVGRLAKAIHVLQDRELATG